MATIAGQKIGNLEVESAKIYYDIFKKIAIGTALFLIILTTIFREQIVAAFSQYENVQ